MTRTTAPRRVHDQPRTVEDLLELWRSSDERLIAEEVRSFTRRGTPGIVIVGRCVVAGVATTIVTTLPWLLRTVGGA